MENMDVFDGIVAELRKNSPKLPKESSHRYKGPVWLYGIFWAVLLVGILISVMVNYPFVGLFGFMALILCSNVIYVKTQFRFKPR